MAIDQISVPKEPLPSNSNRYPFTACSSSCSTAVDSSAGDESADDHPSARKVKLLCSFGGKILPRPSDRALRYAGGETRIIAVRRDTTFPELCRKMADAYGAPIAIRYQLPDEDLDALVSVSSAEDLENMMDEYDKLAEVSGDGSTKLRVFLFTQAEISSVLADKISAGTALIDPYDGGQKYVDAVNGGSAFDAGIYGCEVRPKGSVASSSSTQNLDTGFDGSYNEGASPSIVSPIAGASASFDPSRLAFAGTSSSVPLPDGQVFSAYSTVFGQATVATQPLNPPLAAPYASQAFLEPHKGHYIPPYSLNMAAAPRMLNAISVPQHTYLPCMPISCSSMPAQVGSVKPVHGKVDPFSEDDQLSGGFVQPVSDSSYKNFQQPLSQIPPLQPSHLPPPSIEPYGLHLVPPLTQEPVLRFDDCHLCLKTLPHVHSDRLVNELGSDSGVHVSNDHPIVHSYHSEDIPILQSQHRVVTVPFMDSSVEPKVEHTASPGQYGTYGANKIPDSVLERDQLFGTTAEKTDHSKLMQPYGALGLSGDAQASYGVFVSSPQSHLEGSFQQQQKQILHGDSFNAAKVLHPTVAFTLSNSVHAYNGASLSPPRTLHDDSLQPQNVLLDENADCIHVLHPSGSIGLSTTDQTLYGVSLGPPQPHHDDSLQRQQLPVGGAPYHDDYLRPHYSGSQLSSSNALNSTGLLPNENSMGPINPLLSTMMELHTAELSNTCQASTMTGSCVLQTQNFEREAEPFLANQRIPGISSYITNPVYTNVIADGTSRVWKDDGSEVQNLSDDMAASQRGKDPFSLSTLIVPGQGGQFQESFAPVSLLDNEDPQEILGSTNAYRPRQAIVAASAPSIYGDTSSEIRLPGVQGADMAVLLEEGAFHPSVDWLIKDSRPEPVVGTNDSGADYINQDLRDLAVNVGELVLLTSQPLSIQGALQPPVDWLMKESHPNLVVDTNDYGADYINQDLHDLAEQVVESVLQSSKEMSPPFLRGSGLSEDNSNSQSAAVQCDQRVEDIKARQSDKLHMGLLMANDIGHLQLIKNSDLEELRELGSGTFGTVYHGKWKGSDVAIKRINDRCFAGKPSEQEKMRADFWNEASKLADLHHPNVVAFYGVVIDGPGGSFATVTEYMVNGSLRNALQRNDKAFDRRKRLLIAMDVAFGMEYLHDKNIVHFDLKSDNLLVNLRDPQRPICKVGDLGLSKVKCKTLISGGVRGTLPWMAPELLNGSSNLVSERVDVFSFGIVMWELLTGEEPYSDLHYGAIIGGIVSNTLRPAVPDSCDPEWGALMEQCWSAEPTERPSFTEIANRLRAMAASLPQKGQAQK